MNGVSLLPGFDAVLRDHKRLATKLTADEFRALRDYIEERVRQEQADINFRLYALRNDYDVTVRRSSETISDLYQELSEKKEIIKHYQTSDQTISSVHKQKEQRWERKQDLLLNEIEKLDNEANSAKSKLAQTEKDLAEKQNYIQQLEEQLEKANKLAEKVEEAKVAIKERDDSRNEVLKLKMEIDKRDRQIQAQDKMVASLKRDAEQIDKDKKYTEMQVNSMQAELRKQVNEVAEKCTELSQLQFQLQLEKRQAESLQKQLKQATDDVNNYKKMLESSRPALSGKDPVVITLRKDLDIMDIRIRSLDISVRIRMDEIKKIENRTEELKEDHRLFAQLKSEIYHQGDTYLELSASELLKKIEFRQRRAEEELKYARDWDQPRRDADILRGEVTALMKQASICKVTELSDRAVKQLQKIDLIMRGTSDTVKMPKIYKVSDRRNSDHRFIKKHRQAPGQKPAFITSSTPVNAFDNSMSNVTRSQSRGRKMVGVTRARPFHTPVLQNHTDDTKLQYIDTVELDLSRVTTPSSTDRRVIQSDRMTLKSVSTGNIPNISK